jgi:hypothetical protein
MPVRAVASRRVDHTGSLTLWLMDSGGREGDTPLETPGVQFAMVNAAPPSAEPALPTQVFDYRPSYWAAL